MEDMISQFDDLHEQIGNLKAFAIEMRNQRDQAVADARACARVIMTLSNDVERARVERDALRVKLATRNQNLADVERGAAVEALQHGVDTWMDVVNASLTKIHRFRALFVADAFLTEIERVKDGA